MLLYTLVEAKGSTTVYQTNGKYLLKDTKALSMEVAFFVGFEQVFSYWEVTLTVFSPAFLPLMTGNDFEDFIFTKERKGKIILDSS